MATKNYIPFYYMEKVKRPGQNYFLSHILIGDLPCLMIIFSWISPHPILNLIALIFLTLSFWCIYEIGYYENDYLGEKYEENPILSEQYLAYKKEVGFGVFPWLYSLAFAVIGLIFLEFSKITDPLPTLDQVLPYFNQELISPVLITLGWWTGSLIFVRLVFWVYNSVDVEVRIYLYGFLRISRYLGFALVNFTNYTGAILLSSTIISRWIPYMVYRCGGDRSSSTGYGLYGRLIQFLFFTVIFLCFVMIDHDLSIFDPIFQLIVAFAFILFRAGSNLLYLFKISKTMWKIAPSTAPES